MEKTKKAHSVIAIFFLALNTLTLQQILCSRLPSSTKHPVIL